MGMQETNISSAGQARVQVSVHQVSLVPVPEVAGNSDLNPVCRAHGTAN